jgi:hypothetical protein
MRQGETDEEGFVDPRPAAARRRRRGGRGHDGHRPDPRLEPGQERGERGGGIRRTARRGARDLEKGRRALAKLWNEMDPKTLLPIVESWKDEDLAHQLRYLEADLTATLLAGMKPDRASRLSRSLQAIAAVEGPVEPAN